MSNHSGGTLPSFRQALLLLGATVALAACASDRPLGPGTPTVSRQTAAGGATPFYYYDHQPVRLMVDPSRMIVVPNAAISASAVDVRQTVQAGLARFGIQLDSMRRLGPPPYHWLVQLPGGVDSGTAATARAGLAADPNFRAVLPAFRTADKNLPLFVLNRIVARFKKGVSPGQVDSLARSLGANVVRPPVPDSGYVTYLIEPAPGTQSDVLKIANAIDESPIALWGSPDMINPSIRPMSVPTDAFFPQQYYLSSSVTLNGVPVDINVEPAWNLTKGSSSIRVIFIDTGVDRWHPEWSARGGSMIGFDALWYTPNMEPGEWAGKPYSNTVIDEHGTAVAGIVLASHDGVGTAGIAPNVLFDAVRIFRDTLYVATTHDIANGITWAAAHGDILNNSWGGCSGPSQDIRDAVLNAMSTGRGGKGAVVVFSAGNYAPQSGCYTTQTDQSQIPGVISVAALTKTGAHAGYSLTGPAISVSAFGGEATGAGCFFADVVTTILSYNHTCFDGPSGNYKYTSTFSGTSAAAPQVSGVAALLLSREPNLTTAQVRTRIMANAMPWGSSTQFGAGKLDAFATLSPFIVTMSGPSFITTAGNYTWTANASGGSGGFSYRWDISYDSQNYYDTGGRSRSYSLYVSTDNHFWLKATVTSGSQQKTVVKEVTGSSSGCGSAPTVAGVDASLIPPC